MKNVQLLQSGLSFQLKEAIMMGSNVKINYPEFDIQARYPRRYFTINETADILDVSVRTVYNQTKKGMLRPSRFSKRVFYERFDLIKSIITFNL